MLQHIPTRAVLDAIDRAVYAQPEPKPGKPLLSHPHRRAVLDAVSHAEAAGKSEQEIVAAILDACGTTIAARGRDAVHRIQNIGQAATQFVPVDDEPDPAPQPVDVSAEQLAAKWATKYGPVDDPDLDALIGDIDEKHEDHCPFMQAPLARGWEHRAWEPLDEPPSLTYHDKVGVLEVLRRLPPCSDADHRATWDQLNADPDWRPATPDEGMAHTAWSWSWPKVGPEPYQGPPFHEREREAIHRNPCIAPIRARQLLDKTMPGILAAWQAGSIEKYADTFYATPPPVPEPEVEVAVDTLDEVPF